MKSFELEQKVYCKLINETLIVVGITNELISCLYYTKDTIATLLLSPDLLEPFEEPESDTFVG